MLLRRCVHLPVRSIAQQSPELSQDLADGDIRKSTNPDCRARPPIQALDLIGQDNAGDRQAVGNADFPWIAFDLAGHRAEQRQADFRVIRFRRKNDGGPPAGLLMAGLRKERHPNGVAAPGDIWIPLYHGSFPTGLPVSHSPWMFSGVTSASRSSSFHFVSLSGAMMSVPSFNIKTTDEFSARFISSANAFGSRTARLLPHFPIREIIFLSMYLQ